MSTHHAELRTGEHVAGERVAVQAAVQSLQNGCACSTTSQSSPLRSGRNALRETDQNNQKKSNPRPNQPSRVQDQTLQLQNHSGKYMIPDTRYHYQSEVQNERTSCQSDKKNKQTTYRKNCRKEGHVATLINIIESLFYLVSSH